MKTRLNCVIVDDEKLARDLLEDLLKHEPHCEILASCKNTYELAKILDQEEVDLIFLDIQMPGESGAQFLRKNQIQPKVIFTTAFRDYALDGFELEVLDYLLKPITEDRFHQSMKKVFQVFELEEKAQAFDSLNTQVEQSISIRSGYDDYKLYLSEIRWIESDGEYVRYHTFDRKYMALSALKRLEEELPEESFIRTHRSYIVRKDLIKGREGYELILEDNTRIPIGKTYRKRVLEALKRK